MLMGRKPIQRRNPLRDRRPRQGEIQAGTEAGGHAEIQNGVQIRLQAEALDRGRDRGGISPVSRRQSGAARRAKKTNPRRTLLVAVVLSAQATDAGVNKATPCSPLLDTPEKMVALGEDKVRELIETIGLFRTKAKNADCIVEAAHRGARQRGASGARGARSVARGRPQDRERGAQQRVRRRDHRG